MNSACPLVGMIPNPRAAGSLWRFPTIAGWLKIALNRDRHMLGNGKNRSDEIPIGSINPERRATRLEAPVTLVKSRVLMSLPFRARTQFHLPVPIVSHLRDLKVSEPVALAFMILIADEGRLI